MTQYRKDPNDISNYFDRLLNGIGRHPRRFWEGMAIMSMFDAASDRDYQDEAGGPYPRRVERTCAQCGRTFSMVVEGEYVMHPVCGHCATTRDAAQEALDRAETHLYEALGDFKRAIGGAATPSEAHAVHQRLVMVTLFAIELERFALDRADYLTKGAA
jgi:hypothetical protein